MSRIVRSLADRLWSRVDKNGPVPPHKPELGPCWVWTGAANKKGYGVIGRGGRDHGTILTSRAAWEMKNGPIPDGLRALHHCDNPPCVNNEGHLWIGTDADNMADKMAKGRYVRGRVILGEEHARAKLTADGVRRIRAALETRTRWTSRQLATELGVSVDTIRAVWSGKVWAHLPGGVAHP